MVLETGVEPSQDQQPPSSPDEVEPEVAPAASGDVLFDKVHQLMGKFAANRLGQFVIDRADRLLKTVEDTAKWSLPHERSKCTLERPLSWLPFLLLIVTLRQVRWGLSVGALMIGNGPVTAHDMVYFIQTRRRKLRSIRLQGLKLMRQRELERNALCSGGQDGGFMVKLGKLFTIAICRPGYHSEPARRIAVHREPEESQRNQSYVAARFNQKRQREDDSPEADLTADQLLSKYANENSEDDSDYVPNREDETNDDTSTSAATHSSSEDTQGEYTMDTGKASLNAPHSQGEKNTSHNAEDAGERAESAQPDAMSKSAQRGSEVAQTPPPPSSSQAPIENGPSNGGENRDADVAQKRLLTPSTGSKVKQLNGGHGNGHGFGDTKQRLTPGHESAALSKPNIAPYFRNVTNATTANDTDIDPDDLFSLYPSNVPPSPSSTSSSSSLASFVTSDDFVVNEHFPDAPTPTPNATATATFPSSESPHLTNASSSEDIFSSPIGSPPTLNAFYGAEPSTLKNPMAKLGQVDGHSTPKSADESVSSEEPESSNILKASAQQPHQDTYKQQQLNRYRSRNRR